jgi:hypothetical protein
MSIDMASVYAERFKSNPDMLRAAVMGQSPDPKLDPYTALNALRLVKESQQMAMAGQAQQPTSAPSILAQNLAPPAPPQGLAAMMPMGAPAGQMPQRAAPAPVMQAASGGLASLPTTDEDYCGGGIVAFDDGGLTLPPGTPFDEDETGLYPEELTGGGTDDQRAQASDNVQETRKMIMGMNDEGMSQAEFNQIRQDSLDFAKRNAGPNIYDPANQRLKEREDARSRNNSQGEGLALLAAAGAILEGNSLARGAAKAFPAFAQQMGEVKRADLAEQRSIESMQFSLADAQRKERMGDIRGAQAAAETARKEKVDANRFKLNKAQALAKLDADVYKAANRPNKGAGAQPTPFNVLFNAKQALAEDPKNPKLQAAVKNAEQSVAATKQSFSIGESGPNRLGAQQEALTSKENIEANKALDKHKLMQGREWRKSVEAAGGVEAAEKQFKSKWITNNPQSAEAAPTKSSAAPAASKPTAATKVVSMADVNATVAASGKTRQEVIDALNAKGYTVK